MTTLTLSSGVISSGLTVSSGDQLILLSGGEADASTVLSGGSATLGSGGVVNAMTVSSGGVLAGEGNLGGNSVAAGLVRGVILNVGASTTDAFLVIASGGIARGVSVTGETLSRTTELRVDAGGLSVDLTVSGAGSDEKVSSGGRDLGAAIEASAFQQVFKGGFASGARVSGVGADQAANGGTVIDTVVLSGGIQYVVDGGVASGTTVSSGGREAVEGIGGLARGTIVSSGGLERVTAAGVTIGTMVLSGGNLLISQGGIDSKSILKDGAIEYVFGGGAALATSVYRGATLHLRGAAEDLQVYLGGVEDVGIHGVNTGTIVRGGVERILSGGVVSAVTVLNGLEAVRSGATVSGLVLDSAGKLIDNGSVVISGAETFKGSVLGSGNITKQGSGHLVLSGAGSSFTGQATISGGTIELARSGAIGTGSVVFVAGSASETLQIDAADSPAPGGTFANVISNFSRPNDFVDLRGIAFVSGATASVSGSTLTLSDGGQTYKFHVAGSMGSTFSVTSDGHGGALIDPHVAGFAQVLAGFSTPNAAISAPVSAGGISGLATVLHAAGAPGGRDDGPSSS